LNKEKLMNAFAKVLEDNVGNRITVAMANGLLHEFSRICDENTQKNNPMMDLMQSTTEE